MEYFSYEGGCGICISRHLKEVLVLVLVKYFILLITVILLNYKSFKHCMHCYVVLSYHVICNCGINYLICSFALITAEYYSSYTCWSKFVFTYAWHKCIITVVASLHKTCSVWVLDLRIYVSTCYCKDLSCCFLYKPLVVYVTGT